MSAAVGKILREARQARELTIEQVAETTYIRQHYLLAMEAGDFAALPSPVQMRGFLRAYADFLDIEAEPLLKAMEIGPIPTLVSPPEEVPPVPDEPKTADDPESSFREFGRRLQEQRDVLGLSLEDVERHTHLRAHYLGSLESGDLSGLPSSVQGRGMLKNYASFLGLDPEPLLLLFAEGLQAQLAAKQPVQQRSGDADSSKRSVGRRRFLTRDVVLGATLVSFLIIFVVWGVFQVLAMRSNQEQPPTPPSIADVLLPSPSATIAPTLTPTIPSPLDEPAEDDQVIDLQPTLEATEVFVITPAVGSLQVQIIARQRAWMRVIVDAEVEYDGRVIAGNVYAFAGEELVEILTGNGAAIQVLYNEQDLGILGAYGEVIDYVITLDGVQTPTPTITLTDTPTPEVTPGPTTSP
jgi:cytoskeletal protein RodZ